MLGHMQVLDSGSTPFHVLLFNGKKGIKNREITTACSECRPAVTFFAGNDLGIANQL